MLTNLVVPKIFPYLCTMKKKFIKIIIKVALYALGLIAASFGVSTMTSCSTSHNVAVSGRTTIVSVDTTIVKHSGFVRSKNFKPYVEN
jgi:cell division septal protein FtsQ